MRRLGLTFPFSANFLILVGAVAMIATQCPAARAGQTWMQETFVTANQQTSYSVTKYPIVASSATVTVNGELLSSLLEYSADASQGTITFKNALPDYKTVVIRYKYEKTGVKTRQPALNSPYSVRLFGMRDGAINAKLGYAGVTGGHKSPMSLALDGSWKSSKGLTLASTASYNPANVTSGAPQTVNLTDTLGYSDKTKTHDFSAQSTYCGTDRHPDSLVSKFSLGVHPVQFISITSNYSRNDNILDPQKGTDVASIDAKVTPIAPLAIEASTSTSTTDASSSYSDALSATLKPGPDAKIIAAMTQRTNADTVNTVQSLTVNTDPTPYLSVSGDVRLHDSTATTATSDLTTVGTEASVKIARPLKLTGSYCANPDDSGCPHALFRKGVGVTTTFGCFAITTNYTVDTRAADSVDNPDASFGVSGDLKLTPFTRLTGKYQDKTYFGFADRVRVYTLALTHDITGQVSVSLSSTINVQGADTSTSNADETTTAAVGVKF
ncbi:MAG: hypothetical protein P4L33_08780 [Capsulimonadaceae bacterium]|nr:hypothetical protein [Capsulimonadaceae bacterium]